MKKLLAADLFCGAGGASHGLVRACRELALDLELLAINHWPIAVETHQANHPGVRHLCEAVDKIDPREVVPGGRLNLLLAGPECTHFSTARGGRPVNAQSRASAWNILKWAQELYIDTILIENVPEFRTWGPIGANNKPLKSRKGETYGAFLKALRSLGYRVEDKILCAADYGDPTTRKRLFIVAHRGNRQIAWPVPSHSRNGDPTLFGSTQRWKPARDIIDWSLQGTSIFNRKRPLKPNTIARIVAGLKKFGSPALQPFIVAMEHGGRVTDVDRPLPTITAAKGGAFGVAEPFLVQFKGTASEQIPHTAQSVDEPVGTVTGSGADFGVAEPFLLTTTHGGRVNDVAEPMPTVTGARRGEIGVVEPFVMSAGGPTCPARPVSEPLGTVLTRDHRAVVEAFVLGQQSQATPRSVEQPLPTIATDGAISVIEPFLVDAVGPSDGDARRTHSVDAPVGTVTGSKRFGVAEPFLVPFYGERAGQEPRTHSVDGPVPVIPATGDGKFALIEPFVLQQQSNGAPRSTDEPLPTIAGAGKQALVAPFLTKFYRTATGAQSVDEPLDTITTKDRIGVAEPFIFANRTNNTPKSVDDPIPPLCTADHIALVQPVINGMTLDIRFRMLQPHELAAATSFPKDYQFKGTREEVVKQIGNAWPGELAKALCLEQIRPYANRGKKTPAWKAEKTA